MKKFLSFIVSLVLLSSVFVGVGSINASADNSLNDEIAERSYYDAREDGIVTAVKDQGSSNLCWAYSSIAASETSILKSKINSNATKDNLYLNPVAAAYRIYRRESDPLKNTNGEWQSTDFTMAPGNPLKIAKLFSMWWGPVEGSQTNINPYENPSYRFENAYYIPENKDNPGEYIKSIKTAIAKYGAVTFQYNNLKETTYYNPKNETGSNSSPHACTIIGWNDNIPSSNFVPNGASQNGGWLVKNSYKSCEYFWLSYDNTSSSVYAFTYADKEKYDYNYYYDGNLDDFSLRNDKVVANVFKAQKGGTDGKDEYLKAVNVGISGENVTVEAEIYKNLDYPFGGQSNVPVSGGTSAGKTTAFFEHGGYVTLELDNPVKLEKDEWFSVIVRVSNEKGNAKIITAYKDSKDLSFSSGGGNDFSKLNNIVGRIKAYTKLEEKQEIDNSNFTNLIVLARFSDEDEFVNTVYNGETVRKITDNSYNSALFSVKDYYKNISADKLNMNSVYLFDNGGSIKLSKPRGYYAEYSETNTIGYKDSSERMTRMYELKQDWSNAINSAIENGNGITNYDGTKNYSFDQLDKDNNGTIDSITIIYKNTTQDISVSWASPLWNYQDYADYVTVNSGSKTITSRYYVQLTNSYNYLYKDALNNVILSIGTAVHEMGHILGLRDLYNTSGNSPVYYMSAMAKHLSPIPQGISLKEKEALGWVDDNSLVTLASDGSYKVNSSGENGVIGYKFNIKDKNKTLYLEYRNFGENGFKYDCQSNDLFKADGTKLNGVNLKSGLVCYLVDSDTKFPNNKNYSSPKWNYEVLGGTYSTKSDAALGLGDELDITSKISVSVTAINDNSLEFNITGISDNEHTHIGGEATCVKKAVCSICNNEYGELNPNNHKNISLHDEKSPTCCEDGYTGDKWCDDCNTKIESGTLIAKTGNHIDTDGKYEFDENSHWHTCYFGTKFDVVNHSGGEATCVKKAVCAVCHNEYGKLDKNNHKSFAISGKIAPTCDKFGYSGDKYCIDCKKTVEVGKRIEKTPHTPETVTKNATEDADGEILTICKVCKTVISKTVLPKLEKPSNNEKNNDNKIDNKIDNSKKTLPKTKLLRLKKTKNGVKAVWKKAKVKVSGYQIQYSVSKKFKKAKTVTIRRKKASTFNIKKLKRGKKYFVRVRYFEISNGIKNYSLWSNTKSIKIKR